LNPTGRGRHPTRRRNRHLRLPRHPAHRRGCQDQDHHRHDL